MYFRPIEALVGIIIVLIIMIASIVGICVACCKKTAATGPVNHETPLCNGMSSGVFSPPPSNTAIVSDTRREHNRQLSPRSKSPDRPVSTGHVKDWGLIPKSTVYMIRMVTFILILSQWDQVSILPMSTIFLLDFFIIWICLLFMLHHT